MKSDSVKFDLDAITVSVGSRRKFWHVTQYELMQQMKDAI